MKPILGRGTLAPDQSFNIVLIEPEIAPNVGNIIRLCVATDTVLHLIPPLGFALETPEFRRAALDYAGNVTCFLWDHWLEFTRAIGPESILWFVETASPRCYTDVSYRPGDFLVFGRETRGIPSAILASQQHHCVSLPMRNATVRSLNLANCAAVVLFEALRQSRLPSLTCAR